MRRKFNPSHSRLAAAAAASTIFLIFPMSCHTLCSQHNALLKKYACLHDNKLFPYTKC